MGSIFITGASGFIGTRLLQKLNASKYDNIYCLRRKEIKDTATFPTNFRFLYGSIYDSDAYSQHLASCNVVVHLAATTGRAESDQHFEVNAQGTEFLIEQCKQARVENFVYLSTIAVKYPDISRYDYAQSKLLAEKVVKESGLNYAIIRPTIVIGNGAAIWKTLSRLARLPIPVILGDGKTKIQPIYVDDLVDCLMAILSENVLRDEIFELGGPEPITFEKFIQQIHFHYYGKEPRMIHVPSKPFLAALAALEDHFSSALPLSVGQLSAFIYDGTIARNKIFDRHAPQMKNVDEMLNQVIANDR